MKTESESILNHPGYLLAKSPIVTAKLLTALYHRTKNCVTRWRAADGPNVGWQGVTVKAMSDELDIGLRMLCDAVADTIGGITRDFEPSVRRQILAIDQLAYAYRKFMQDASFESPTAPPSGSDSLWNAWDAVERSFNALDDMAGLKPPPPVHHLIDVEKVSPMQIARIYGWIDENGDPDTAKVFEERDKPGTHFDPKTWVHPAIKSSQKLVDAQWSVREPRGTFFQVIEKIEREIEHRANASKVPSIEEFVAAGAPAAQIARVHGIDVAEAERLLFEAGKGPKREILHPANEAVAHQLRMEELDKRKQQQPPPQQVAPQAQPQKQAQPQQQPQQQQPQPTSSQAAPQAAQPNQPQADSSKPPSENPTNTIAQSAKEKAAAIVQQKANAPGAAVDDF
jgi:hypothetical protein